VAGNAAGPGANGIAGAGADWDGLATSRTEIAPTKSRKQKRSIIQAPERTSRPSDFSGA